MWRATFERVQRFFPPVFHFSRNVSKNRGCSWKEPLHDCNLALRGEEITYRYFLSVLRYVSSSPMAMIVIRAPHTVLPFTRVGFPDFASVSPKIRLIKQRKKRNKIRGIDWKKIVLLNKNCSKRLIGFCEGIRIEWGLRSRSRTLVPDRREKKHRISCYQCYRSSLSPFSRYFEACVCVCARWEHMRAWAIFKSSDALMPTFSIILLDKSVIF